MQLSQPMAESQLVDLVNCAYSLSANALTLVESLLPNDNISFETIPEATIWKLHLSATGNYRAGLVCLRQAETSMGAPILLRGILEVWSHIKFIAEGDSENSTVKCRALSYELGAIDEWDGNMN
jgi:hypothetical protein